MRHHSIYLPGRQRAEQAGPAGDRRDADSCVAIIAPNCTTAPNYTASQTGKACPKPAAHTGRPKSYYVQLGCAPRQLCVFAMHAVCPRQTLVRGVRWVSAPTADLAAASL